VRYIGKGTQARSKLSKTSNIKVKEKTAVSMSNPSQTFPLSAHNLARHY